MSSGYIDLSNPVTKPQTYTATTSSGLASFSIQTFSWFVGPYLCGNGKLIFTGSGGPALDLTCSIPSGLLIDTGNTTFVDTSNKGTGMAGYGYWFQQGSGWLFTNPNILNSTTMFFTINTQHLQMNQFGNGDGFNFVYQWLPILGR